MMLDLQALQHAYDDHKDAQYENGYSLMALKPNAIKYDLNVLTYDLTHVQY